MTDDAHRSALRATAAAQLLAMHVPAFAIGRWCSAWEAESARQGLEIDAASWTNGIQWIVSKIAAGEMPPD